MAGKQTKQLQQLLNTILNELGAPINWTQEKADQFYKEFCQSPEGLNNRLILKITDVINIQNEKKLFFGEVLNPDILSPFTLPFEDEEWNASFVLVNNTKSFEKGDIVIATPKALKIEMLQGERNRERRMKEMISIRRDSVKGASFETRLMESLGDRIVEKLSEQFGSLEKLSHIILYEFERAYQDKQDEIQQRWEILQKQEEEMRNKEEMNKKREQELNDKEQQLKEYESELLSQFERFRLLPPLSIFERKDHIDLSNSKTIQWSKQEDIIDIIRGALHTQCNLQYERDVIECFVGALKTNQLIILHGPSGTGKSSLVRGFSKIIKGAKTYTIRVQSSWTDKQDILGFFNPIDYQYVSTEFLDALVEARENPKSLYLICLDEMNLSHVEYYFAEFLSAREEENPKITLYSKYFQELAYKRIKPYITVDENGLEFLNEEKWEQIQSDSEKWRLQNCFDLCHRYPAEFEIPSNVRFVGTMNMDHTVKGLSPKVIDRSFVINLRHSENEKNLIEELEKIKVSELISVDVEKDLTVTVMDENCRRNAEKLNPWLDKLGARLNRRALDQIGYYGSAVNSHLKFDQIVRGKILPRIQVSRSDETVKTLEQLSQELQNQSDMTQTKIREMLNQGRTITYWR
ncbi:dynein-related subfamily AAA family protein [Anoxybacillus vitaminiphilus]|uniref:Dynein-related subfamily AAA family protein n=1 Tax=Paranoxybacillus vitaminiphilus TaxID=581036 RepID=A0A327YQH5_9BACL|nr:dynein-related subfamily AAA family protein [Anoxybacillus vitaminiphilus]